MHRPRLLWVGVVATSITALAVTVPDALHARARAATAQQNLRSTQVQAEELRRIRARIDSAAVFADDPEVTFAQRVASTVADAGFPASELAAVSSTTDSPVQSHDGHGRVLRRRATVTLDPITLEEVGRFLEAWRQREPAWTISAVRLAPKLDAQAAPGGDLPVRATLTVEALAIVERSSG